MPVWLLCCTKILSACECHWLCAQALLNSQADILVSMARDRLSQEQLRLQHAADLAQLRLELTSQHNIALQATQKQLQSDRAQRVADSGRQAELAAEVTRLRSELAGEAAAREVAQQHLAAIRSARDTLQASVTRCCYEACRCGAAS